MSYTMIMPKISLTMTEGTIVKWHKKQGDTLTKDELLVDISSDKMVSGEAAPCDGILLKIVAENDAVVPVGGVVAYIGSAEEKDSLPQPEAAAATPGAQAIEAQPAAQVGRDGVSPLTAAARRWVRENGHQLADVEAAFAGQSRVTTAQVEQWLEANASAAPPQPSASVAPAANAAAKTAASRRKLVGMRKAIAEAMVKSKATAPHATICREVDMSAVVKQRNQQVSFSAVRHSVTDYVTLAAVRALTRHPEINCSLIDGEIITWEEINIGVAVASPNGLTVPVIHNADKLSFDQISLEAKELAARVLNNKTTENDFAGGTFTISSMGMMGIDMFTPVLNQPEAAILGVGRIVQRPVIKDGQISTAHMMYLSLSFDHRVLDGSDGASFLETVSALLENPTLM